MGTTRTALLAGSVRTVKVLAIEGYEHLICEYAPTAVATAWAAHPDHTSAIGGLYCDWEDAQKLHPYEPFTSGGVCQIRIAPDADDTFGRAAFKRIGAETILTETINRSSTTINVASTTAFPESGTIYIGTECITYTGKTATSFTGCTRGKFSPVLTANETRYAHDHRVNSDVAHAIPAVSSVPRVWIGRWCAVYEHRVVGDTVDVLAEAEIVYFGRIADLDDDGRFSCIELRHVLDVINDTSVGRSPFTATVKEGLYLFQNQAFRIRESVDGGATLSVGETLTVSDSPSGRDQLQSGYYTSGELMQALTSWFAAVRADSDFDGVYAFSVEDLSDGRRATRFLATIDGTPWSEVVLEMPDSVIRFFGYDESQFPGTSGLGGGHHYDRFAVPNGSSIARDSAGPPLRSVVDKFSIGGTNANLNFEVFDERGTFVSQFSSLPQQCRVGLATDEGLEWGVFLFNEKILIRAAYDATTHEILRAVPIPGGFGSSDTLSPQELNLYAVPESDDPRPITIRQILVMEAPAAAMFQLLLYSTGTLGHNHTSWDALPFGVGLGIPGGVLGSAFEASVNSLPGASTALVVVVDKPTTLGETFSGDLVLRRAFTLWKQGTVRFGSWRTPVASDAVAALSESTKAAPGDNEDDHRAFSRETDEWVYPVVKIHYDRDLTDIRKENFRGILTIEDSTSVDDMGGEGRVLTVKSKNTFADGSRVGASLQDLLSNFVATFPMTSRPQRTIDCSISPKLYDALAIGDIVTIEDSTARDPDTGLRGMAARPALVIGKRCSRGGAVAGSDDATEATGTVTLFFSDTNPERATAQYAPTADIDHTYDTGDYDAGYNATTQTIRCHGYRYSDDGTVIAPVLTDAEWFPAGSVVRIVERDPEDPTSPQAWQTTVASQSVDDIELDDPLTGFDNTKRYRVYFAPYDDAIAAQRTKVFQADAADNLVQDLTQAYQYGSWPSGTNTFLTSMNSTIGVELPADETFADGAPRDVGTDQALVRAFDAFIDYQSGLSLPYIGNVLTNTNDTGGTWLLLEMSPVQLTDEILSNDVWRELGVSAWFRSSDGSSVQVRATLTRTRPSGSTVVDVNRGSVIATATWTSSSTTWGEGARIQLDCRVKDFTGRAWLLLEGTLGCETRGLSTAIEGPRLYENQWWIPI